MRRRAFLLNSSAILLLIPLMLLLATYENVSYQIIHAQSERMQLESTSNVVSNLELDFQKALEISTRRALIATTEYVATRGFITGENANKTIADLILQGSSSLGISSDQSIKNWLESTIPVLRAQGYSVSPSVDDIINNITITVAPLDSFHIAVIARIPRIRISSESGRIIYSGAFPRNRNGTVIVGIEGIEDTFIARETHDLYHRLIEACRYPYPELMRPIIVINGTGVSSTSPITGIYGSDILYNETRIWKNSTTYITNLSSNPVDVIQDNDVGVLVFDETGSGSNARAYDIQPFVNCLESDYYFGLYNAPSFFERLEGSFNPTHHREYEELATRTQDMLGISYNGKHYPIGLVSFILPSDSRIQLVLNTADATLTNQTCFDYYFLKYYIDGDSSARKSAHKMYGVSAGNVVIDDRFYLDNQTAVAIFGTQGAQDLLQR